MTNDHIRFGVLGFGGAGQAHLRRLTGIPGITVAKVYDPKIKSYWNYTNKYQEIDFTDNFSEILDGSVDAVTICTPDHTHFEYASQTVTYGLHTLVEKPMFVSLHECNKMEAILSNSDVVFGVHHQMRYIPAFRFAHDLVQNGELGDILLIEADYIHDMRLRANKYDPWRMDSTHPQNIVLGGMSHTIDLMRWIVGNEVTQVFASAAHRGWPEYPDVDTVIAMLNFQCGTLAKTSKTITSSGPQRNELVIYGTRGQIHNNVFRHENGKTTLTVEPNSGRRLRWVMKYLGRYFLESPLFRSYPFSVYEHEKASVYLLNDFINAIRRQSVFPVSFAEGRASVELCLDCITSYQKAISIKR